MKEIKLKGGEICLVDDDDFDLVSGYKWYLSHGKNTNYARSKSQRPNHVAMHRLILNLTDPKQIVDHIDGNGLNNVRKNLRICTVGQNLCNRTPHKNKSSIFL